jgi:flagellar hook assembly protein FlgD
LSNLSEGTHTVAFKAWDINNNSSEAYTEFVVSSSAGLALDHVLNYPNPFTTHTSFFFEHNRAGSGMKVQIQIYTVSGKLVKTLDTYVVSEGFRNTSLEWDGKDDFGDQLAKGVYIYRLKVRTDEGLTAQKLERLVILR